MERRQSEGKIVIRTLSEFDSRYLPKFYERRMLEEEGEKATLFAERLTESLLEHVKNELAK
jgi:hypothetical protein